MVLGQIYITVKAWNIYCCWEGPTQAPLPIWNTKCASEFKPDSVLATAATRDTDKVIALFLFCFVLEEPKRYYHCCNFTKQTLQIYGVTDGRHGRGEVEPWLMASGSFPIRGGWIFSLARAVNLGSSDSQKKAAAAAEDGVSESAN